uniref:Uncharacterized protein n=1 Tax=Lactuca sativa TaxID=4236 RepID=A0A9R1UT63_LACSA|nr:hypothetical protein LSAT_V11C800401660 [Lactuca sativa]
MDGTQLQEVRRGVDRANIYGISLSPNVQCLAVSSDKGTVHIFSLRVHVFGKDPSFVQSTAATLSHQYSSSSLDALISPSSAGANPGSSLSFRKGCCRSILSLNGHLLECMHYMKAFRSQNIVIIAGMDGRNWLYLKIDQS